MSLYRNEALQFRQSKFYGDVLITRPLSVTLLTSLSCAFVGALLCLLVFGEYTQKQRVTGVIVPDLGLVKIRAPQPGTILSLHVREGEQVREGQLLYTLSSERITSDGLRTDWTIREGLVAQRASLAEERERQRKLNAELYASVRRKLSGLNQELERFAESLRLSDAQIELARDSVGRYELSVKDGVITKNELQEKRAELLRLESSRSSLLRERSSVERQVQTALEDLATTELQGKNQLAQIERAEQTVHQTLLEADSRRELRITAPIAGTITAIVVKPGQATTGAPLLSIVPSASTLQAELYAPTSSISFVKKGNRVLLRFLAFPYQKFGQQAGVVADVSRAALPLDELRASAPSATSGQAYRVTVSLPKQTIVAYGNEEPVQPGMEVEADILLDTRRLYEWLFEPLYSLAGRN